MNRIENTPRLLFRWAVAVPALVALGVSVYLTVVVLAASGDPVGCGDGGALDCEHVLSSRWSKWLGVPVSAPAVGLYATAALAVVLLGPRFSASLRRIAWSLLLASALTAAGAAFWFVALQWLVVKELCPYCMTVHGCGLIFAGLVTWRFFSLPRGRDGSTSLAAMRGALAGPPGASDASTPAVRRDRPSSIPALLTAAAVLATLVVGQLVVGPTSSAVVVHFEPVPSDSGPSGKTDALLPPAQTGADSGRPSKLLVFAGKRTFIDVKEHMILGSPDAEFVIVKLYDYTCRHCRKMHRYLEQARQRYGEQLAIVLAPVPLNRSCNRTKPPDNRHHKFSCLYAHLARAVWVERPEQFEAFHNWLMQGDHVPSPSETKRHVATILGSKQKVELALLDKEVKRHINICVDDWVSTGNPLQLPKVLFGKESMLLGDPESAEWVFEKLEADIEIEPVRQ